MSDDYRLYMDASQPIEKRVEDLLGRMTLEEKITQLGSHWVLEFLGPEGVDSEKLSKAFAHGVGQISRIGGATNLPPEQTARITNEIQRYLKDHTRLAIPAIVHEECLSGYMAKKATAFPQIIGLASTWEPELAEKMTGLIREQMRSVGAHQGLSPVLDIARDPRWGRTEETFGEDPYLISRMGTSYVKGLQGEDPKEGILATGKHFLGYGLSEGGMNCAPAHIPQRELLGVFAKPFEAAIREANIGSIMNAYHELDGIPCGVSKEVLTEILRERLGFRGFVSSDYMAIAMAFSYHHVSCDLQGAAIQAITAGLDVELPRVKAYGDVLIDAVKKGLVEERIIDESVKRVLRAKFSLGLFENPFVDVENITAVFTKARNKEIAREIARKSMVLLRNGDKLLPLKKDMGCIAVIGPNADSVRNLLGDYSHVSHIREIRTAEDEEAFTRESYSIRSVLEAIKDKVSPATEVLYAKGCGIMDNSTEGFSEAVEIARKADLAIVVVGEKCGLTQSSTSGEGRDRADLNLPGVQEELVKLIYETGTPIVLVLINGRPLSIKWAAANIPAILEAWVPGEEGGDAIADVLFGDAVPGGKLPISFPQSVGQIPIYHYHKPSGGRSHFTGDYVDETARPLFPFGYGLSYTSFGYSNLQVSSKQVDSKGKVKISLEVKNTGTYKGDEIVQLYFHDREATITRPVRELVGFKRVTLEPGASCKVTFTVNINQLGFYNREMQFIVEPGNIDVMVGSSSEDIRLEGEFEIVGETIDVSMNKSFFSDVVVEKNLRG